MSSSQKKSLSPAEHFALGAVAGVLNQTTTAPIERVKLLLQTQAENLKTGRLSEPYKGAIDCTVKVFRTEGVLPFWRGNLTALIGYFPTMALSFALKDKMKTIIKINQDENFGVKLTKNVASGGTAGIVTLCFVYSLGYARTRLATDIKLTGKGQQPRQFSGLIDVYRKTLRSDGFTGLYRGFGVACVGITVYRGCYFGFYDTLKPLLLGEGAGVTLFYCLGFATTILAGLVSYPLDTVCHRMMMTSGEAIKYRGSIDCAIQIFQREGAMSFMKGAGVSILRGFAGAGVLAGYDKLKEIYIAYR